MPIPDQGLSGPLVRVVPQFDEETPVQVAAIPAALAGRDLLVRDKTGSGKTTAFVLPILEKWLAA